MIQDELLKADVLLQAVQDVMRKKDEIDNKIKALKIESATDKIVAIIKEQAHVQTPRIV